MRERLVALGLVVLVLIGGMAGRVAMSVNGDGYRIALNDRGDGSINVVDSKYTWVITSLGEKKLSGISPCSTPWSLAGEDSNYLLGCASGLFFSSNAGRSWKKYKDGHFLSVAARGGIWVAAAWNQGVYTSFDNGANWHKSSLLATDSEINAIGITNREILLGGLLGIFSSSDKGDTFSLIKGLSTRFTAIEVEPSAVYAGNWTGEVWKEDNSGWRRMDNSKSGIWALAEYGRTRATAQGLERTAGVPRAIAKIEAIAVIVSGNSTFIALAGKDIFVIPANILVKSG